MRKAMEVVVLTWTRRTLFTFMLRKTRKTVHMPMNLQLLTWRWLIGEGTMIAMGEDGDL